MIFNLFHRAGLTHTYDYQRKVAHDLKLKATVFVNSVIFDSSSDEINELTQKCKDDNRQYGDEIALWLEADKESGGGFLWLLSEESKRRCIKRALEKFESVFGYLPKTVGNYVMDSSCIKIVKELCPDVKACVAGCFEEGVKVFHGCNNSWYLFSEGMSWNPWYPSKGHSVRPAENEDDWAGVVAVPHLCRDLVFGYESRNDFFASHPANVQRGLANDGLSHEYDYNLCDQYRMQEDYNDGFSYYQIHVSPGWLNHNINIIDPDEVTQQVYRETLEYIAKLRDSNEVRVMSFSEFADEYKSNVPIGKQTVAVGKDILIGSGKQYYWVFDTNYRVLVDTFQGGSIGDLRPYAGKYNAITGPDAENGRYLYNSYPYLIQSQYRSGYKNHFVDGSRTTLFVKHNNQTLDMCAYNTRIQSVSRTETSSRLALEPVEMKFEDGFEIKIQTVYEFLPEGKIKIERRVLGVNNADAEYEISEYVKACYGFIEYPEDMKNIVLKADGTEQIKYDYDSTSYESDEARSLSAVIPEITTEFELCGDKPSHAYISEGNLFSPYYVMRLDYKGNFNNLKEATSWLQLKQTV